MTCPETNEPLPDVDADDVPSYRRVLDQQASTRRSGVARGRRRPRVDRPPRSEIIFWIDACLGTTAAGGLFGIGTGVLMAAGDDFFALFIAEGIVLGIIVGCTIAGFFGILIHSAAAFLTWLFDLSRFRFAAAATAGSLTGVSAATMFFPLAAITGAGLTGALGSSLAGALYCWWCRHTEQASARWQFSLRHLFVLTTVVSVLLGIGMALVRAVLEPR